MTTDFLMALSALITAVGAIIGAILGYKKTVSLLEQRMGFYEERLKNVEHYNEKLEKISVTLAKIETDIEYLK